MDVQIECPCPPKADGAKRHAEDTVTLRDTLDFRTATAIRNTIAFAKAEDPDVSSAEIMALLTEGYIVHGIVAWTLVDAKGKPVPVTKPEIRARLLADPLAAEPIGDAADGLYAEAILLPLVQRALASSRPSPTDNATDTSSTSAPTTSPARHPKPSKRSSTSTSGTAGTATITSLRVGGSNSSPSSASAA